MFESRLESVVRLLQYLCMDATRGVSVGADAMLDVVAARARLLWQVQGELLHDLSRAVAAALAADPGRGCRAGGRGGG